MTLTAGADRARIARRGLWLQYATIAWNSGEFVVAVVAGVATGSVALVGFGVDSALEATSRFAALWRLRHDDDLERREAAEGRAQRMIGACFIMLALYVAWEAAESLLFGREPEPSRVGIALAALSLVVMPVLVHFKRRVARALASGALAAESRQTAICAWLSAVVLAGLGLNAWLGWWWADAVAALLMTPRLVREGVAGLRGRACGD